MKKYVFITNSIRNMGGAQMHLRNKIIFLREHGWSPTVFFFNQGEILIPELKEYEKNLVPEMAHPITAICPHKRERIIKRISEELKGAQECIFESHIYPQCYWAEEFARHVNGRHIIHILHESFPSYNKNEEAYLAFKLRRGEFMNSPRSIETLLKRQWDNKNVFYLSPYSNVTAPIDFPLDYDKTLKTILSLGRLDKPYILPMLREIVSFSEQTKQKVNLFLVGGASEESFMTRIKSYLDNKKYIIPYYLGYMYPVPETLIVNSDVAIASSGSVLVSSELGVPTIAIDTQDFMAMGVYGITTKNILTRVNEPQIHVSVLLQDILINGMYGKTEAKPSEDTINARHVLEDHYSIIESLNAPKEYYDVFAIFNRKEVIKQKILMWIYSLYGEDGVAKIARMRNLLFKKA